MKNTAAPAMNPKIIKPLILSILILIIAGIAAYSNSFNVPFLFDDVRNIEHSALRMQELSIDSLIHAGFKGASSNRPVVNISMALNSYFGGFNVWGYHLVNLTIHLCAGIILYLLLRATLTLPPNIKFKDKYYSLAFITALIWLLHPLNTQSVTYIVQRMNSMAAMLYILALLLYVYGRRQMINTSRQGISCWTWLYFSGCLIVGILAIGSKEIAATLPIIIFLYEWFFFQDLSWKWLKQKTGWLILTVIALGILIFIFLNGNPLNYILNSCNGRDFTTIERVMTQFRVVMHYIELLLYPNPSHLIFDYNFPLSTSLFHPVTTILSLGGLIIILGASCLLARKERLLSFCLLWFLGNLAIESSVICLELIFEHRTYLPSMFGVLFITATLHRIFSNKLPLLVPLTLVAALFGYWTYERNITWQDPVTFWSDSIKKSPGKVRPYANLGFAYAQKKEWPMAIENLRHALYMNPEHPAATNNLATVLTELGQYKEAEQKFLQIVQIRPYYLPPKMNYAHLLTKMGRIEEAIAIYKEALTIAPKYSMLNKNLGQLLLRSGHPHEAISYLKTALERLPESIEIRIDLGDAFTGTNDIEASLEMYRSVLKLDPKNAAAHYRLAILLIGKAPVDEIISHYLKVIEVEPTNIPALYNLANNFLRAGKPKKAQEYYKYIISLEPAATSSFNPEISNAYNNLGLVYLGEGLNNDAEEMFKAALNIMPNNVQARQNLESIQQMYKVP